MEVTIGQQVKFINENLKGEIIAIVSKDKVLVACSDGFDHEVMLSELLIIGDDNSHTYIIDNEKAESKVIHKTKQKEPEGILSKYIASSKYKYEGALEIDLHLEKLVEFPGKLDDSLRLHTQMQHVKNCLSAAKEKNIKKIVFIHGVGTGVLKMELHNYLSNFDFLIVKEADFREYGSGATEVIIKNS
ncbi:MAG: hypothetical protein COA97_03875 [Flavobacteriales bacterium]|nr:MAG: hypothetical protein COA97_03875 [Flavobacteriales bacterium]